MKKYLFTLMAFSLAMSVFPTQSAMATSHKTVKKAMAKPSASPHADSASANDEETTPDTSNALPIEFQCELGNKLTVYQHSNDAAHITLRWKTKLHHLSRVDTSTGANRFENRKYGLVWIGIPTKSMLLDAKKGQQLANECKSVQQQTTTPQS